MFDLFSEIGESMGRHRMRTLATAFGVFWGIFMVGLLLAGGHGMRNGLARMFSGDAVNLVWIEAQSTTVAFDGLPAGRKIQLDIRDVEAIAQNVPELELVSPREQLPLGQMVVHEGRSFALPVIGVYPEQAAVDRALLVRGRMLNPLDVARERKVALIGSRATPLVFGTRDPVGRTLTIGNVEFEIVGEYRDEGSEEEGRRVYIPFTTLKLFGAGDNVSVIMGALRDGESSKQAGEHVARVVARRHRFDPSDRGAIETWFMEEVHVRFVALIRGIDVASATIGFGTLLSGMVGVSNILFVSVRERASEFGVRRALGATARSVLLMVVSEALVLALAAGALGMVSAYGLVHLAQELELHSEFFERPAIDLPSALAALALLVVTALFAGYFPAREAARMKPIEALRRE